MVMASWKERGEVPDSDDEDDSDGESIPTEGYCEDFLKGHQDGLEDSPRSQRGNGGIETQESEGQCSAGPSKMPAVSHRNRDIVTNLDSPSPRIFRIPPPVLDLDQLAQPQKMSSQNLSHFEEEISQSYIRLSSPSSSSTSLPTPSQLLHNAGAAIDEDAHNAIFKGNTIINCLSENWDNEEDMEMLVDHSDFPSTSRRSLRRRNPIQLHPYVLEGEKYRRTLMARGLRPLRLAQVMEDSRKTARENSSPDPDFEAENESQSLSVEDELPLPQSSELSEPEGIFSAVSPGHASTQPGGDDDEFPDIDQLLDRSNENFIQLGQKRQKTNYGSRYTSRIPSRRPLPRLSQGRSSSSKGIEVSDVPPSPPATSSPAFPAPSPGRHQSQANLALESSRVTSLEYVSPGNDMAIGNLPTPATNPVKHTIDLTTEDLSDQDPFTSDTESSALFSSSEPDQSVQVRRVGKKIRGVLPASWLRLDQQARQEGKSKVPRREHRSLSPAKAALSRRGVAIPKDTTKENSPSANQNHANSHFMLDDSDEDDESGLPGYVQEPTHGLIQDALFSQTEMNSVIEDDRIDSMLPSQKRQTKLLPDFTQQKKRPVSTSLFVQNHHGPGFQPKITDHLSRTRNSSTASQNNKSQRVGASRSNKLHKTSRSIATRTYQQASIPKLSILDVINSNKEDHKRLPAFIRIAARNARSSKKLGRHSPTRKFIKLASREDTQDAQSVLRAWREGTLHPRAEAPLVQQTIGVRQPLLAVSENACNQVASGQISGSDADIGTSYVSALPRKILISKSPYQPKLARSKEHHPSLGGRNEPASRPTVSKSRVRPPRTSTSLARPAQLETSVSDYSNRHANLAFGSTKKFLDTLYRKTHKGSKVRGDVQLARYLGDDVATADVVTSTSIGRTDGSAIPSKKKTEPIRPSRHHKRVPRRVDAGAAAFRQPSEPLILDFLQQVPENRERLGSDGKLLGLGKFGTTYTHHFDIFPLQYRVFFHETTFVGSGRLCKALGLSPSRYSDRDRGYSQYQLAGKQLRWGPWGDIVSSEVGMCFDWIIEQLEDSAAKLSEADADLLIECITHIIDYIQTYLSFPNPSCRKDCVFRFNEVLHTFNERLELLAHHDEREADTLRVFVELSSRILVLVFQFLKISQFDSGEIDLTRRLESLLQRGAKVTIGLLLTRGLDPIRNLYDDLQYMAYREAGIKSDRYAVHAWVIAMHVMQAVQIPRVSFWDIVNSQLIKDETQLSDARVLERMWYSMFSILPFTDFDTTGVIVPSARLLMSYENWALPQKMAKKIFELYNSKSRQSPSFNDYCRAFFSRCSHLIQTWGWRRHALIVGTLFDFFAIRKLAHLRNEEVYKSPRFLEELDTDPSLNIDPDDRCFHILLKIIAISIKQMRAVGDTKGIRNLVTRVLPNHDRQYPKDKTVHQRDLASLRNHHDLLCTLFWAAPLELRPSISLIRELVNPESSHQEAYLINLRSWENLTRFVLGSTPTPTAYLPLATWQNESFTQLLAQYQSAEKDIEEQLQHLPPVAKQLISQQTVAHTIQENRKQIIMSLFQSLIAIKRRLEGAKDLNAAKVVIDNVQCIKSLKDALSLFRHRHDSDWPVVEGALDIIYTYITLLNKFIPVSRVHHNSSEDDSQDYGSDVFSDVEVGRLEYVGAFDGELLCAVRDVLRTSLRSGVQIEPTFMERIVDTWALMAGTLILSKTRNISDFLSDSGDFNELRLDDNARLVRYFASHFMGKLATVTEECLPLEKTDRDLLSDWLCILIKPLAWFRFEHTLFPIFAKCEPLVNYTAQFPHPQLGNQSPLSSLTGIKRYRGNLLDNIFQNMYSVLRDNPSIKHRYQEVIRKIMANMKKDLCDMEPQSQEYCLHENFVVETYSHLATFFRDLCPIDQFFYVNSTYPSHSDPHMFVATIRNYGLRLHTDRGKNELNHYFLAVLKQSAIGGSLQEIPKLLEEAMGKELGPWTHLSNYILRVLTPSYIHAAFVSEPGWLLAEPLFEAAQEHLMAIADCDRNGALTGAKEIMITIVNAIARLMELHSPAHVRASIGYELVYMLLLSTRFMFMVFDWLAFTMEQCEDHNDDIMACLSFFYYFSRGAKAYLKSPLQTYIKNLQRYHFGPDGEDDREELVAAYEACAEDMYGDYDLNGVKRDAALKRLTLPFAETLDDYPDRRAEIKLQHDRKFISGVWLFHDLRNEECFEDAKGCLKWKPDAKAPEPSAIILSDIRQNWGDFPDNGDITIRSGKELGVAIGLLSNGRSVKGLFEKLQKALDEYVARFERAYGSRESRKREERTGLVGQFGELSF